MHLVLLFGIVLISVKIDEASVVVKNPGVEIHRDETFSPYESRDEDESETTTTTACPFLETVENEPEKSKRGERIRKRKEKRGKFGRERSKTEKTDEKQILRSGEKASLVRNRTVEILKKGARILNAGEEEEEKEEEKKYREGGNKGSSLVNETLLEKILSSAAVSKPDLLVSASGIYRIPIGGDVYASKKLATDETDEPFLLGKWKNKTSNESPPSGDYERSDRVEHFWHRNETLEKNSFDKSDRESVNLDRDIGTTLEHILSALVNSTDSDSSDSSCREQRENEDPCRKWLACKRSLESAFLGRNKNLPSCPCSYPSTIFYDDKIWDRKQKRWFRWRDASGETERLDVYKPGASYCIRSLLPQGSFSLSSQHCCYDRRLKLLTRGSGAGTINYVSPDISRKLHDTVDVLPWRLCKGDFARYNRARRPDNGNECPPNPDDRQFRLQLESSKYF